MLNHYIYDFVTKLKISVPLMIDVVFQHFCFFSCILELVTVQVILQYGFQQNENL